MNASLQTITTDLVKELIKFDTVGITKELARTQLRGIVAIYNKLVDAPGNAKIAYLADEVGMGKTYVALGVLSVMRHFRPNMRAVIVAPRKHMQEKWENDYLQFTLNNYKLSDLAVRNYDGSPVRRLTRVENLLEYGRQMVLEPDSDILLRMPSFSLALVNRQTQNKADATRSQIQYEDLVKAVLGLKVKNQLDWTHDLVGSKKTVGKAINRLLRPIDLLIIDEAHNLKHGIGNEVAIRNKVINEVFKDKVEHVLLLSATPIESSYDQLYNQLQVFGKESPFSKLDTNSGEGEDLKEEARKVLIRRVYDVKTKGGESFTRNQYRREWRRGGVMKYDEGIKVEGTLNRMILGLMQLKVQEALGKSKFPHSFQMGLLASFESYSETVKSNDVFQGDKAQDNESKQLEGADVITINGIAKRYRSRFKSEIPHPKMDKVCEGLQDAWDSGEKALVFVRRIGSATEIVNKLLGQHDEWLMNRLVETDKEHRADYEELYKLYKEQRRRKETKLVLDETLEEQPADSNPEMDERTDQEDNSSFFAWFFREGNRTKNISFRTGGWMQKKLNEDSGKLSTVFHFNDVASVLHCRPNEILQELASRFDITEQDVRESIGKKLRSKDKRQDTFELSQLAVLELICNKTNKIDQVHIVAQNVIDYRYEKVGTDKKTVKPSEIRIANALRWLQEETLWSAIEHTDTGSLGAIRGVISVDIDENETIAEHIRKRETARLLMNAALRKSHAAIDLYCVLVKKFKTLKSNNVKDDNVGDPKDVINDLLKVLEEPTRPFTAIHELTAIAQNLDVIIRSNVTLKAKKNDYDALKATIDELYQDLLPAIDMTGGASTKTIKQFRMPGYPFILVATDVISEGQDLHLFCRRVYHYGIAWMPSSMEQRTGRIDRANSKTERMLKNHEDVLEGDSKLQVYLPYLEDTIEVIQIKRVLDRMNEFIRALHNDLQMPSHKDGHRINIDKVANTVIEIPPQLDEKLTTAFDVTEKQLNGSLTKPRVGEDDITQQMSVLRNILSVTDEEADLKRPIQRERNMSIDGEERMQRYKLSVSTHHGLPVVVCSSYVGQVPLKFAKAVLGATPEGNVRYVNGLRSDSDCFDCHAVGEVFIDTADIERSRRRVDRLINDVACSADQIERTILKNDNNPLEPTEDEDSNETDK